MTANILFVDDEPLVLNGLRRMLRNYRKDLNIVFASSGQEAMNLMDETPFDAIVSDMRMPEITGNRLLRHVSETHPNCARMILSGHSDLSNILDAVSPTHQFYSKPCNVDELSKSLKSIQTSMSFDIEDEQRSSILKLKSLPSTYYSYKELAYYFSNPSYDIEDLYDIVSSDVAMSAQVLRLVNSSFFGKARFTLDVRSALQILGQDLLKRLFEEAELFCYPEENEEEFPFDYAEEINCHAHALADDISFFAADLGYDNEAVRKIRSAAMLSFIGPLACYPNTQDLLPQNSHQLSSLLLTVWGFDDDVVSLVNEKGDIQRGEIREFAGLLWKAAE